MRYNQFAIMKKFVLFSIAMLMSVASFAQESSQVEKAVDAIVKKYDDVDKVECVTVTKGNGLEMLKMLFNKQFGKDFMRGVTSITFIEYSEASKEVCQALRKELDAFTALLEEFKVGEEDKFANNDYVRCFAAVSPDATLSDFVFALEDEETKMLMYMAGKIKVE